jgi:hypothetical protein
MHPNEFKSLIKECIIEVLKEDLAEAFDPTSQGPNPVEENPYVRWNAHMRKLEESTTDPKKKEKIQKLIQKAEAWVAKKKSQGWTQKDFAAGLKKMLTKENEHGRYAQQAGAGQFDPRTFGVNEYAFPEPEPSKNIKFPKSVVDIARIIDQVCSEKGEDITNHLKIGYSRQNKCWILKGSKYFRYLMYLPDKRGWVVVYGNTPTILKPKDVVGYAKRWLG